MSKLRKIPSRISRFFILKLEYINSDLYRKKYIKWLTKQGVKIQGIPNYISNTVYFDGSRYECIELGDGCTISRDVLLLTHDYSMHTVLNGIEQCLGEEIWKTLHDKDSINNLLDQRPIRVGNHSFIGARSCLLPGTIIGDNCIIGAGSVVKGVIPDNSIVIGNPAKIYKSTSEWLIQKAKELKK